FKYTKITDEEVPGPMYFSEFNISGAEYRGDPQLLDRKLPSFMELDNPKSMILIFLCASSKRFSGFKSVQYKINKRKIQVTWSIHFSLEYQERYSPLWMTSLLWVYSSAESIWLKNLAASFSVRRRCSTM